MTKQELKQLIREAISELKLKETIHSPSSFGAAARAQSRGHAPSKVKFGSKSWGPKTSGSSSSSSSSDKKPQVGRDYSYAHTPQNEDTSVNDDIKFIEALLKKLKSGELVKDDILRKQLMDILSDHRNKISKH